MHKYQENLAVVACKLPLLVSCSKSIIHIKLSDVTSSSDCYDENNLHINFKMEPSVFFLVLNTQLHPMALLLGGR